MKPYYTSDFPEYSKHFRQYCIALVEMMRILREIIVVEGIKPPSTEHIYNMVTNSLYEVDSLYEEAKGVVKNKTDRLLYIDRQEIMDTVVKTIQAEIQSLKTSDN